MKLVNIMHNYVIFYYRVNCVTRPGSFVVIAIIAFAVTICVCLAISCPYVTTVNTLFTKDFVQILSSIN